MSAFEPERIASRTFPPAGFARMWAQSDRWMKNARGPKGIQIGVNAPHLTFRRLKDNRSLRGELRRPLLGRRTLRIDGGLS
jgi:hypothetical protein